MEFRPAKRANAKPLIGIYAESGCGKTYSSLLLARGFVGPSGRIGMIETESGRGEAYADPVEYPEIGGYDVLSLHGDFSPSVYGEAIQKAEAAKFDALIVDSASAEWEGVGGVLDMAATNEANGKKGPLVWQKPKIEHQRHFMLRFMQSPIPLVILCMRAKYPMEKKGSDWVRSTKLEPKQSEDVLYEMFSHGWIDSEHKFHRTKSTAKALEAIFIDNEKITLQTGANLAAWARGEGQDGHIADLIRQAEGEARSGLDALRGFWKRLGASDREAIKSQANRLKTIAEKSDQEAIDPILALDGSAPPEAPPANVTNPSEAQSEPLTRGLRILGTLTKEADINDLCATVGEELSGAELTRWQLECSAKLGEKSGD